MSSCFPWSFLIILEKIQSLSKWKRHIAEFALIVLIALAAEYTKLDGGVYGILLVAAFYLFHDSKAKMFFAAVCVVLLSSCHIVGGGFEFATANVFNPDVAAAVVSLLLINLYNGKRGLKLKYFFYVFLSGTSCSALWCLTYCFELSLITLKQVSESRNKLTLRLLVNFRKT
mgnify:FL=1